MKRLQVIESRTQPDNTNVLWLNLEDDVIYRFSESGWIPVKADESITENAKCVTYSELVKLRDYKELIPGTFYRITDYITTTIKEGTSSAGHQFDIIVLALTEDTLCEEARACLHEGDTYFSKSNLNAWRIWYKLQPQGYEFDWASSSVTSVHKYRVYDPISETMVSEAVLTGTVEMDLKEVQIGKDWGFSEGMTGWIPKDMVYGQRTHVYNTNSGGPEKLYIIYDLEPIDFKGVIYRMIDEYNNDLPYDFKNILIRGEYTFGDNSTDNSLNRHYFPRQTVANNTIKPYYTESSRFPSQKTQLLLWYNFKGESVNNYIEGYSDRILLQYSRNNIIKNCQRIDIGGEKNTLIDSSGVYCSNINRSEIIKAVPKGDRSISIETKGSIIYDSKFENVSTIAIGKIEQILVKNLSISNCEGSVAIFSTYLNNVEIKDVPEGNLTIEIPAVSDFEIIDSIGSLHTDLSVSEDIHPRKFKVVGIRENVNIRNVSAKRNPTHRLLTYGKHNSPVVFTTSPYVDNSNLIMVTYEELVNLRNNNHLIPGTFYQITDYVTTFGNATTYGCKSAEHPFHIIVLATSTNSLSEEAKVAHSNDSYFRNANANLDAWKIWYCLDNDIERFGIADPNGKGYIYRMIDEWGNDWPCDFKNLMYTKEYVEMLAERGGISELVTVPDKNVHVFHYGASADYSLSGLVRNNRYYSSVGNGGGFDFPSVLFIINNTQYKIDSNTFISDSYEYELLSERKCLFYDSSVVNNTISNAMVTSLNTALMGNTIRGEFAELFMRSSGSNGRILVRYNTMINCNCIEIIGNLVNSELYHVVGMYNNRVVIVDMTDSIMKNCDRVNVACAVSNIDIRNCNAVTVDSTTTTSSTIRVRNVKLNNISKHSMPIIPDVDDEVVYTTYNDKVVQYKPAALYDLLNTEE